MNERGILTVEDLQRRSVMDPLDRNPYDPCWHDSLFERVDPVRQQSPDFVGTTPQPIVTELDGWPPLVVEGDA